MPIKGKIVPAFSSTPGSVPDGSTEIDRDDGNAPAAPSIGELVSNVADGIVWIKKSDGSFTALGAGGLTSDDIANASGVSGTTISDALDALDAGTIVAGDITGVSGLSVIGRASNSSGAAAAITASLNGQVLGRSGTSLSFLKIDDNSVTTNGLTYASLNQATAYTLIGNGTGATRNLQEITTSAFILTLLDDTSASAARTTLGLAIGTNVQAYDAELSAIAGLTSAADSMPYFTGSGTAALATVTSAARSVLDDTTVAAMVNTLGGGTATGSGVLVRAGSPTLSGTVEFGASGWKMIDDAGSYYVTFGASSMTNNVSFKLALASGDAVLSMGTGTNVFTLGYFSNAGLHVYDTDSSHYLSLRCGSDITASRALQFITGDAARDLPCYSSATSRIMGRKSSGAGNWEECTLSETLDFIGSAAQGDILYRGASAWARLGAGTSGQRLKTSGAGSNPSWADDVRTVMVEIGDGSSVVSVGTVKGTKVDYAGTITSVTMVSLAADGTATSGSAVVDIWKDTYANYPPTVADSICAAAKPTISAATKARDSTLTGWTTSVSAGDFLLFNVDSCSSIKRLLVFLTISVR